MIHNPADTAVLVVSSAYESVRGLTIVPASYAGSSEDDAKTSVCKVHSEEKVTNVANPNPLVPVLALGKEVASQQLSSQIGDRSKVPDDYIGFKG